MGLALNVAVLLREWLLAREANGPVLTLGVMDVGFTERTFKSAIGKLSLWPRSDVQMTAQAYFETCGMSELSSMDVSRYEGADFEFDLNNEDLPTELVGRFGVVLNGGTLEHVFHVPNALTNITRMLKPGGLAIHILPMSNCIDHGFYQFSPTLMLDYYAAARYELLHSASIHFEIQAPGSCQVRPALTGSFGEGLLGTMDNKIAFHMFAARKLPNSLDKAVPIQSLYGRKFTGEAPISRSIDWFAPFEMKDGKRTTAYKPREVLISSASGASDGQTWTSILPDHVPPGDNNSNPIASVLGLFEDGKLLGPPHSSHETIRTIGKGAYSHWGSALYFSTSDGSDPNTNGRRYTCKF
ncbi:methyltransferase domain-containing protein [Bradyrhizobium arachidis]|uniref:Methyltransferase domain-containing protein n=1 Tax=Bradyrhizobium arachidis TaxID=858423 RepID=A0AAE7NRD6_9BRAD|nr:methyltransferase domain-containing protein [Bradyrhizobium arachidis]QOZ70619.1 methyltransferase domain-containing protein [Bradyrhizobium arachidis]